MASSNLMKGYLDTGDSSVRERKTVSMLKTPCHYAGRVSESLNDLKKQYASDMKSVRQELKDNTYSTVNRMTLMDAVQEDIKNKIYKLEREIADMKALLSSCQLNSAPPSPGIDNTERISYIENRMRNIEEHIGNNSMTKLHIGNGNRDNNDNSVLSIYGDISIQGIHHVDDKRGLLPVMYNPSNNHIVIYKGK